MAGLKTTITLQDRMSGVLRNISKTTTTTINSLKAAGVAGDNAFSPDRPNRMKTAIDRMKNSISESIDKQHIFNAEMEKGAGIAGGLFNKIKGLVAAYAGARTIKGLVEMSDTLAQNYARLNLMNDNAQTTKELFKAIQQSAKESRGDFQDTFSFVAKIGNTARGAFKNSKEIVTFAELIQKSFKISGTKASEASNAMLQLSQALGAGVLRGEDLRSILGQAPGLIQLIAKEMGVSVGQIRKLGEEGKLTADVIRNAVFNAADDINEKFSQIPMTWSDVWTNLKTDAITALEPVLGVINRLANNQSVVKMMQDITTSLGYIAIAAGWVVEKVGAVYEFFVNNFDWIVPIVGSAAVVVGAYSLAMNAATIATKLWELEQKALGFAIIFANSNLLIGITIAAALITTIILIARHIAKTSSVAKSTFGVIMGWLNVIWAALKNTLAFLGNIGIGIMGVIYALLHNAGTAIHNGIRKVDSWIYGLLSTALKVVEGICEALNKLPFVKFDFSGISNKAAEYAEKAAAASADTRDYINIGENWKAGMSTFKAFESGWANDAFAAGAAFGDGVTDKVKGKLNELKDKFSFNMNAAMGAEGYGETLNNIANDTSSIAKNLSATNEDLSWLRELAEREAINRFTTAEIKIDMTGMTNEIHRDVDVDGMYNKFVGDVGIALQTAAAGVY